MATTGRYARQEAVEGWDQSRLTEAAIAVAGCGPTAFFCGLMAAAMGFGRLVLLGVEDAPGPAAGGPRRRLLAGPNLTPALAHAPWGEIYRRINPSVRVYSCHLCLEPRLVDKLPAVDALIVAGNDLPAREAGERLARDAGMPVVAGGTAGVGGIWGKPLRNRLAARLHGHEESPLLSQIIAALLVEEARKALMPLAGEAGRTSRTNALALSPRTRPATRVGARLASQRPRLALVGAGALGTWFGLALGFSGLEGAVAIYDDDVIDETNLNRQILFHGAVGQPKATVLARRLQGWFTRLRVSGYGVRADDDCGEQLRQASVLVACPDNFRARALLNRVARRHERVLLSGGTSAMGGSCAVYEPGHTACLSCRMKIEELASAEERPQGCGQVHAASVVTSNAITGALMVLGLRDMLRAQTPAGIWEYDGTIRNTRIGVHSERPACHCHLTTTHRLRR